MITLINVESLTNLTSEAFYDLCLANADISMERSIQGELIIMSPVGGESGNREANLIFKPTFRTSNCINSDYEVRG